MADFRGKPVTIQIAPADLSARFADLTVLQRGVEALPAEQRERLGDVSFETDAMVMNTPQVGRIVFRLVERTDDKIRFQAEGSPVPVALEAKLKAVDGGAATEVNTLIDVEIPAMLKPMVSGPLQKAADQFGTMLSRLV